MPELVRRVIRCLFGRRRPEVYIGALSNERIDEVLGK